MSDLNTLTIADARDALRKGETTSVALTEACLAAIEGAGALGAFVHNTPELALDRAAQADALLPMPADRPLQEGLQGDAGAGAQEQGKFRRDG